MTLTTALSTAVRRAGSALFAPSHWSAWAELRRLPPEFSVRDVMEDCSIQTRPGVALEMIGLGAVGIGGPVLIASGLYLATSALLHDVDSLVFRHAALAAFAILSIAWTTGSLDAIIRALRFAAFSSVVALVVLVGVTAWPQILATDDFRRTGYIILPLVVGISFGMLAHSQPVTTSIVTTRVAVIETILVTALACVYGGVTYALSHVAVDLVGPTVTIGLVAAMLSGPPTLALLLSLPNSPQRDVSLKRGLKGNAPIATLVTALAAATIAITSHAEAQHRVVDPAAPLYGAWVGSLAGITVTSVFLTIRNLIAPVINADLPRRLVPCGVGIAVWALLSGIGFRHLNGNEYFTVLASAGMGVVVGWIGERRLLASTARLRSPPTCPKGIGPEGREVCNDEIHKPL